MWNVLYEDRIFHIYSYPFVYALAGVYFLTFSAWHARRQFDDLNLEKRIRRVDQFNFKQVLDLSLALFITFFVASKAGGAIYARTDDPVRATFDLTQRSVASDWGAFVCAFIALGTSHRSARLTVLWNVWAGPALLAGAIGALGCFAYGCCFGRPLGSSAWYSVQFPTRYDSSGAITGAPAVTAQMQEGLLSYRAKRSLPVHPVQLYLSALLFLGGAFLIAAARRCQWNGWFLVAMTYYLSVRVALDPMRGDYGHGPTRDFLPVYFHIAMALILSCLSIWKIYRDACRK